MELVEVSGRRRTASAGVGGRERTKRQNVAAKLQQAEGAVKKLEAQLEEQSPGATSREGSYNMDWTCLRGKRDELCLSAG